MFLHTHTYLVLNVVYDTITISPIDCLLNSYLGAVMLGSAVLCCAEIICVSAVPPAKELLRRRDRKSSTWSFGGPVWALLGIGWGGGDA